MRCDFQLQVTRDGTCYQSTVNKGPEIYCLLLCFRFSTVNNTNITNKMAIKTQSWQRGHRYFSLIYFPKWELKYRIFKKLSILFKLSSHACRHRFVKGSIFIIMCVGLFEIFLNRNKYKKQDVDQYFIIEHRLHTFHIDPNVIIDKDGRS